MKQMMARGKPVNPWEVDYSAEEEKRSAGKKDTESLLDKAKSFSF